MTRRHAAPLFFLAAFCLYGFLASFEPGSYLAFRVGYPIVGVAATAAGTWLLFRRTPDS